MSLNVADYDFELPESLIAKVPVEPRDESRLLVLHRASGRIEHRSFRDLPEYFDRSDLCIANNTKVLKARLLGRRLLPANAKGLSSQQQREQAELQAAGKTFPTGEVYGGAIEMLLLEKRGDRTWEGAFHSTGKQVSGLRFVVENVSLSGERTSESEPLIGEIVSGAAESPAGTIVARFNRDPVEADAGELPLPHYMERKATKEDLERYQTVFAKELGSAAAPTAGLHFTPRVLEELRSRGSRWEEVTLHVGLGTFRPVKTENILDHKMHEERYIVPDAVAEKTLAHRRAGGRVTAIGTTAVRTLESAFVPMAESVPEHFLSGEHRTDIFLHPGGRPIRVVDRLVTNFHLPKSTLLMLVSAFAGRERMLAAYAEAVKEKYRFFSYGDAMLIL